MSKTVSSRIPKDLHDRLRKKCNEDGCNTNDFIRNMLEAELTEENYQDQEESKKPLLIKVEDVKEFDCKNGNLYENGSLFGKCSDYELNDGKVYEKNGKYLRQIKNDSKSQLVKIPHATIEII